MTKPVRAAIGLIATLCPTLTGAPPARAQACEWDGERMICPVHPQSSGASDSLPFGLQPGWLLRLFKPGPRKVDEALQRNLSAFDSAFGALWESTPVVEPFNRMKPPRSNAELDRRMDRILATVWPTYRAQVAEYGLLVAQKRFYDGNVPRQQDEIAAIRERLPRQRAYLSQVEAQAASLTRQLAATREFEGKLANIALTQLNDHRIERAALATLLVYSPNAPVRIDRLDQPPVTTVSGRTGEPAPGLARAGLTPGYAIPGPPTQLVGFNLDPPAQNASIDTKVAVIRSVSRDLQQVRRDMPIVRESVARLAAEYRSNIVVEDQETAVLRDVITRSRTLEDQVADDTRKLSSLNGNLLNDGKVILRELLADAALERATALMTEKIEEIAGAQGLIDKIPRGTSDGLVKLAKEGRQILLPHAGFERQWATFIDAQEKTVGILDRAEGSILEAARLAAGGSAAATQAHMERVFGNANDEAVEFVKLVAAGEIPEGENPPILSFFDKYLSLRKEQAGR